MVGGHTPLVAFLVRRIFGSAGTEAVSGDALGKGDTRHGRLDLALPRFCNPLTPSCTAQGHFGCLCRL